MPGQASESPSHPLRDVRWPGGPDMISRERGSGPPAWGVRCARPAPNRPAAREPCHRRRQAAARTPAEPRHLAPARTGRNHDHAGSGGDRPATPNPAAGEKGFPKPGLACLSRRSGMPREDPGVGVVSGISGMAESAQRQGQLGMALKALSGPKSSGSPTSTRQRGPRCPTASAIAPPGALGQGHSTPSRAGWPGPTPAAARGTDRLRNRPSSCACAPFGTCPWDRWLGTPP